MSSTRQEVNRYARLAGFQEPMIVHDQNLPRRIVALSLVMLALGLSPNLHALSLGPANLSLSECGLSVCMTVQNGGIALNPVGPDSISLDLDFGQRIALRDPGFDGGPPFLKSWELYLSFSVTDTPSDVLFFITPNGALVFKGLDDGEPDLDVRGIFSNGNVGARADIGAGSYSFSVDRDQPGLVPGFGFRGFAFNDLPFLPHGESATLILNEVRFESAALVPLPASGVLLLAALGVLKRSRRVPGGHGVRG